MYKQSVRDKVRRKTVMNTVWNLCDYHPNRVEK
jgi:hypothetical protein